MDLAEPQRRRRGPELEAAILEAAWDQLAEHGYGAFTIDAVAQRAGTSKPVIYRRWADKHELVRATVRHVSNRSERPDPNTGSLREDMLALVDYSNRERFPIAAILTVQMASYFRESGTSPADLREVMLSGVRLSLDTVLERAVQRGEVDPERLTPRIKDLPFALYRQEVVMSLRPVPREVMEEILDTIFLPLVRPSDS